MMRTIPPAVPGIHFLSGACQLGFTGKCQMQQCSANAVLTYKPEPAMCAGGMSEEESTLNLQVLDAGR